MLKQTSASGYSSHRRGYIFATPILVVAISLAISVALGSVIGWRHGGDSDGYLDGASRLLAHQSLVAKESSYIGYIALVAASRRLGFGETGIHILQVIVAAFAAYGAFVLATALTRARAAGWWASLLVALNPDLVRWQHYLLTDSLYTSCVVLAVWATYGAVERKDRRGRLLRLGLATILVLCSALLRPNGWLMIVIVPAYLVVRSVPERPARVAIVVGVLALAAAAIVITPCFREAVERETPGRWLRRGQVIWGYDASRLKMPLDSVVSDSSWTGSLLYVARHPIASARLGGTRMLIELAHVRPFYSFRHNVILVLLVAVYAFAFLGYRHAVQPSPSGLIAITILCHMLLVGATFADWDGRFLLFVFPLITILAAAGVTSFGNMNLRDAG